MPGPHCVLPRRPQCAVPGGWDAAETLGELGTGKQAPHHVFLRLRFPSQCAYDVVDYNKSEGHTVHFENLRAFISLFYYQLSVAGRLPLLKSYSSRKALV